LQRQDAVVLEQHHALAGDLARQRVVRGSIEGRALGRFLGLEDDAQNAAHRFVEHGLVELAAAHGLHHGLHAARLGPGISRSRPALQRGHAIVHRAPVGDHKALEAPLVLEDLHQHLWCSERRRR
jgi:hypothetical protein